jgi:sugar transferase (PEP-CTERM/EpsH1 system associated)
MRAICREIIAMPLTRARAGLRAAQSVLAGRSASEGYFGSHPLERGVLEWARNVAFDAVLAFSSSMAPLALKVPARRRVLDMVDLDSVKWAQCAARARGLRGWVQGIEARRVARGEREWIAGFDATVLVNDREARLVPEPLQPRVHVIETGHLTGFDPAEAPRELPDEPVVGFVGAMDYGPNIDAACWFAEEIWPRIRDRRREARWCIVGRSPAKAVRQLESEPGIEVTGTVPAVEPYFDRMRVHVAPLRIARGVQTKVIAAMAAGRPCVVTPCVADGIGALPGQDYLVANSPSSFADAVLELLHNRSKAEAVAGNGREFVQRRFNAQAGLRRLEALLLGSDDPDEQTV